MLGSQLVLLVSVFFLAFAVTAGSTGTSIQLRDDGLNDLLDFLLLFLKIFGRGIAVRLEPRDGAINGLLDRLLVALVEFAAQLLLVVDLRK